MVWKDIDRFLPRWVGSEILRRVLFEYGVSIRAGVNGHLYDPRFGMMDGVKDDLSELGGGGAGGFYLRETSEARPR
jgi:hypothetical protein